jgi:carbohydrate-binding DOMON domain-containing protein
MRRTAGLLVICLILSISDPVNGDIHSNWLDPVGDERGVYPTGEAFTQHPGVFDITEFQITGTTSDIDISFTFTSLDNPENAPNGFTFPIIQVYFHTSPRGSYRVIKHGYTQPIGNANIILDTQYQWNLMVQLLISPL